MHTRDLLVWSACLYLGFGTLLLLLACIVWPFILATSLAGDFASLLDVVLPEVVQRLSLLSVSLELGAVGR